MAAPAGPPALDELRHRYAAQPRRYLAPLANALRQQGALEEAVTMLRAQLAEYPDHLTGHVVLGRALFDTGALAESREAFERARTLDPGNPVVLRHLGEIASLGGDVATARRWYGRLRAAEPFADDVAAQLGGRGELPPAYDVEEETPPPVPAGQEVREAERPSAPDVAPATAAEEPSHVASDAPAAIASDPAVEPAPEPFELLEFAPAAELSVADVARANPAEVVALDPVVGLDLPPAAPPAELREGIAADDDGQLGGIAGGPFATETMAGLLAAQGHTDQAVALYERLVAERPDDAGLRARLDALRGTPGGTPVGAAADDAQPVPVQEPAAEAAAPHPAHGTAGDDDAARAVLLADAFSDVRARAVQPAAVEHEHRSGNTPDAAESSAAAGALDAAAAGTDLDPFAEFSFDRFFADEGQPAAAAAPVGADDADLARFDAWLQQTGA